MKIKTVSKYLSIKLISFTVIENSFQETPIIAKGILSYRYKNYSRIFSNKADFN